MMIAMFSVTERQEEVMDLYIYIVFVMEVRVGVWSMVLSSWGLCD
jgi:hypothetical protein